MNQSKRCYLRLMHLQEEGKNANINNIDFDIEGYNMIINEFSMLN